MIKKQHSAMLTVMINNYVLKVLFEALATPATYLLVRSLKRAEGLDVYDHNTNFNPFVFDSRY